MKLMKLEAGCGARRAAAAEEGEGKNKTKQNNDGIDPVGDFRLLPVPRGPFKLPCKLPLVRQPLTQAIHPLVYKHSCLVCLLILE